MYLIEMVHHPKEYMHNEKIKYFNGKKVSIIGWVKNPRIALKFHSRNHALETMEECELSDNFCKIVPYHEAKFW